MSASMGSDLNNAPLAVDDEEETPPKCIRYASRDDNCENDGVNKSLFYESQLSTLLSGIISDRHISEKERHDKLMKACD